ncbi:AAA family ATPase [Segatella copri]|nr:AAA family ATPase [Segatella copri]
MFVNDHLADTSIPEIYPNNIGLSAEDYFNYFTIGLHQKADSLQQIFYGAPGTGKSHAINELTAGKDVIRTTFHPDTDYSTFVGAYKPTTKSVPVTTVIGTNAVPVMYNGKGMMEDKIVYEYVSQAFLQAYVAAWRKYCDVQEGEEPVDEFLVIEEINRGNCAQIFGDLFQLLDRGDEGFSEYPIKADSDMKKLLEKEFEGLEIKNKEGINALFKGGKDIVAEVLAGDVLLLPNNLYIWATMNTSDQSLFPIDSAFKRRWDWNYVPISNAGKNWMIEVNGAQYDWWNFLEAINDKVYHATYSEDKKLGYFFCKAKDGVISADKFVSKVIFYLWNDVFKDSEFEGDTFKDEDGEKLSFDKFYSVENNQVKVNGTKIVKFLSNLNLEPDSEDDENNSEEGVETEGDKKLPKTPKVFSVEFPDGTVINEKNRFETYLKVLSKIGIEQVEKIAGEMKYQRRNTPLVTKKQHEEILNDAVYSYVQEGDYYIVKGIDAITMYNMVMLLDNRLDLQLKVCYE